MNLTETVSDKTSEGSKESLFVSPDETMQMIFQILHPLTNNQRT